MSHPLVGWRTSDQDGWGLRSNLIGRGIFEDFHGNLYSKIATPRATVSAVMLLAAALQQWLGKEGVIAAAAIAGFADTHSAAVAVASLVAAGKLSVNEAVLPILASLTTNTITKIVLAVLSGNWRFISAIIPGLVLVILAAWLGAAFALGYF